MTKNNPFPGMNPFLERHWLDVHTKLIAYIADAMADALPDDLQARSEERVTLVNPLDEKSALRADVAVVESWQQGIAPQWQPDAALSGGVIAAEPQIVIVEEITERWVEITDTNGKLITVIEVLSPTNKGSGHANYLSRRDAYIQNNVNLVEIDLLRGGSHTVAVPLRQVRRPAGACYLVCVTRGVQNMSREVYAMPLRLPLPTIRVPLRAEDDDVLLSLQPLVDRCYRMGGYWKTDQTNVPSPPLENEDAAWVSAQVQTAGLQG